MKRKRLPEDELMARRRRAERKAGIRRDPLSAAAPFSTKLAREGHPHGKTAASLRSVGLPPLRGMRRKGPIEPAADDQERWPKLPACICERGTQNPQYHEHSEACRIARYHAPTFAAKLSAAQ